MTKPGWRRLTPPFLTGAATVVAGTVAAGLLLYDGPGFLRALSVLLAVLLGSLGLGTLAGRATWRNFHGQPGRKMRRLWLFALIAMVGAMLFAAAWEIAGGFGATALSQAAGLALLGALPFYGGGAVLGAMSAWERRMAGPEASDWCHPAVLAFGGSAVGALGMGFFLFPTVDPATMLFLAVLCLALAAQAHLGYLDRVSEPDVGDSAHRAPDEGAPASPASDLEG